MIQVGSYSHFSNFLENIHRLNEVQKLFQPGQLKINPLLLNSGFSILILSERYIFPDLRCD